MNSRFQPGDHLKVRRPAGYFHHGIYVSDDRVIQYGSGVNLWNKGDVGMSDVPLMEFENGGTARVVRHGYESLLSGWHPPADEPWQVIERAEFLLKLQPRLPYNLIGHNCEIIANMCVSNRWTESYQARRFFTVQLAWGIPLALYMSIRGRANRPLPRWVGTVMIFRALATFAVRAIYNRQIKRFWQEIFEDWQAHEQVLAQDPRNGQDR